MGQARERVTEEETRAVWQGLREEVEQLGPDDLASTDEHPPLSEQEAAAVLRHREQRTPPGGLAKLTRLVALVPLLFLSGCGLTAAQWEGLVDGGIKLGCTAAVDFVPQADAAITAKVCQGVEGIGEPVIKAIIEAAAGQARSAHLVQPQGDAPPRRVPLVCAGKAVATMPASYAATLAQGEMAKREECR